MNMILHGNEIADIRKGDTITSPQFTRTTDSRPSTSWLQSALLHEVLEQRT